MAGTVKMNFEGMIYSGAAGSTASTLLENCRDITYNMDPEYGDTTARGDSSAPPIKTEETTMLVASIEFTMLNDTTDTDFEDLRAAAYSGDAVAIRTKDYASGKGFDGDVKISIGHPFTLAGEQVVSFKATPTRGYGRMPSLYV